MLGYALLGFTYIRAINTRDRWAYIISILAVLIYAVSDEFHQSFVPGRNASPIDVGIDTVGAILGVIALRYIHTLRKIVFLNMPGSIDSAGKN